MDTLGSIQRGRDWWRAVRGQSPRWLDTGLGRGVLLALALWLALTLAIAFILQSQRIDVHVGDLAPRNVVAPYGVINQAATARARAKAAAAVPPVYDQDPHVLTQAQTTAAHDFALIGALAADSQAPLTQREAVAAHLLPIPVAPTVWGVVLSLPPTRLRQLQQDTMVVLASVMGSGNGVRDTTVGLDEARTFAARLAAQETSNSAEATFLADLSSSLVAPNTFLNAEVTKARRAAAAAAVPAVKILKGEQVLTQGQVVTPADIAVLRQLGLLDQGFDPGPVLGAGLFAAVVVGLLAGYVWYVRRNLLEAQGLLLLTAVLMVVALVGAQALSALPLLSFMAVPAAAMMAATLVDAGLGVVVAGILALAVSVLSGADVSVALVSFFGSLAGVYGVSRLAQRYDLLRAGMEVGLANLLALAGLTVMEGGSAFPAPVWQLLLMALVDGILASVAVMVTIPFLEGPFGIITALKLIELSNPNQPLLRQLLVEAPGTYHHSIVVGNLAEAATEAVGGNSLLARVGAYYHDIGKSKRPYFFIDNQFGAENPHDRLSPGVSALIIASHVRDGVELARKHHLPQAIINFIQQHHGTTLIRYFYEKALASDTGEGVEEADFRYEGPRPQSKETAIVMMADASEATTRTLKHPTPQAIEQVVRRIIRERLEDGQLDDSNLTLKELDVIAQTFTRVLTGVFHQRIEYPEPVLREIERSRGRADLGGKPGRAIRRVGGNHTKGGSPNAS